MLTFWDFIKLDVRPCSWCNGLGEINDNVCPSCQGWGTHEQVSTPAVFGPGFQNPTPHVVDDPEEANPYYTTSSTDPWLHHPVREETESKDTKNKDKKKGNNTDNQPKLTEFESLTKHLPMGTISHIQQGTSQFDLKTFYIVKDDEDQWHQIDNFHQQGRTYHGKVKAAKFNTNEIVSAKLEAKGVEKPGERITNVLQMAVLPDHSVIEYTHKLLQEPPKSYVKVNGKWHKSEDPKGYDSELFASALENGTWIWMK